MKFPWVSRTEFEKFAALFEHLQEQRDDAFDRSRRAVGEADALIAQMQAEHLRYERLVDKLVTMTREGFTPAPPPIAPLAGVTLDALVADQILLLDGDPRGKLHQTLTRYAMQETARGVPAERIAEMIARGDG